MTLKLTNPLHLYRALLRETTYLFDPSARHWTRQYVESSFRSHAAATWDGKKRKTIPYDPSRIPSLSERHLLKRGRKFLSTLQRANEGYTRPLKSVLQLTYGRAGRRKRLLLNTIMQPDAQTANPPSDAVGNGPAAWPPPMEPLAKYSLGWKPSEEFMSMLHTQNQLSDYLSINKTIKLDPLPNKQNRWGDPMHPNRVKNTTKRWYAKMASILLPPLQEQEWNNLRDKALGKEKFCLIPRRPMAKIAPQTQQATDTQAVADSIVLGLPKPLNVKTKIAIGNPHKMTQRFLSRFYGQVALTMAPLVSPHPEGKGLVSKWDNGKRNALRPEKPKTDAQVEALFG